MVKEKQSKKKSRFEFITDIFITIIGTFVFAFGLYYFIAPNHIAPGGVTGIAIIINYFSGVKIGTLTLLINIPLMIIGFFFIGKKFMAKTAVSLIVFSIIMDYILPMFESYTNDRLISAIFGGVLTGAGLGMIFARDASTGGMDIVNKIIAKKNPHIKIGQITLFTDLAVVLISAVAYKDIGPALYAVICLYISSVAIDTVLYGFNKSRLIYVISKEAQNIREEILSQMNRGVTVLESFGGYTLKKQPTLMVAIRQTEYPKLKRIVKSNDKDAFLIAVSTSEIVGYGFDTIE